MIYRNLERARGARVILGRRVQFTHGVFTWDLLQRCFTRNLRVFFSRKSHLSKFKLLGPFYDLSRHTRRDAGSTMPPAYRFSIHPPLYMGVLAS